MHVVVAGLALGCVALAIWFGLVSKLEEAENGIHDAVINAQVRP
jgi:hypothetical protein